MLEDTDGSPVLADPGAEFDVFLHGTVFLDIIFTGLAALPSNGTEVWAQGMGSCPGGIANLAIATSRLGLRTSLAAAFGDDDYGEFCWRTLSEQEGVDLSHSERFEHWHTPVTVSMATQGDRSMVSHGHAAPVPPSEMIGKPPPSRAVMVDLTADELVGADHDDAWAARAAEEGALVFADVGWDATGTWSPAVLDQLGHCHAFLPNAAEAMAYTHTDSVRDALYVLADKVPLAVVTDGANGAVAIDSTTGEEAHAPALRVPALDPTGAGDVFGAGVVLGTLSGWPLEHRLAFATACSALAVQQFGGSLAAPGWGDLADWWHGIRDKGGQDAYHTSLVRRYGFLDDLLPVGPISGVRRAAATIARFSDVGLARGAHHDPPWAAPLEKPPTDPARPARRGR
jgi:sugar/nucleoside kinase (ribokinase family)